MQALGRGAGRQRAASGTCSERGVERCRSVYLSTQEWYQWSGILASIKELVSKALCAPLPQA
jgi:hypothetical protein